LVGGDFYFCLDNVLDGSSSRPLSLSKAAKSTTTSHPKASYTTHMVPFSVKWDASVMVGLDIGYEIGLGLDH